MLFSMTLSISLERSFHMLPRRIDSRGHFQSVSTLEGEKSGQTRFQKRYKVLESLKSSPLT